MDVRVGPESSEFWVWRNTENLVTGGIQEAVLPVFFHQLTKHIHESETFEPEVVNIKPCCTSLATSEALCAL